MQETATRIDIIKFYLLDVYNMHFIKVLLFNEGVDRGAGVRR